MASEDLFGLTEMIYEAATGSGSWQAVGHRLQAAVGARTAAIMVGHPSAGAMEILHHEGIPPDAVAAYRRYYRTVDLWTNRASALAARGTMRVLVQGEMLVPDAEYVRSEFWNDFGRPLGLRYVLGTVAPLGSAGLLPVGLHRAAGAPPFGAEERRKLSLVLPHMVRALQLRHRLGLDRSPALAALDALPLGLLVLGEDCAVVLANRRAEAMAKAGGIRLVRVGEAGSHFRTVAVARRRVETDRLLALVRGVAHRGEAGGAMRLHDEEGSAATAVLVAPLPQRLVQGASGSGTPIPGQALVLLRDLSAPPALPTPQMLSDLFGLTAAEAAVAHAVAAMPGRGLNGIAARLNIAETTLKTHLARVFLKTGAAGQADLVRMLAGLAVS
ncbi:helix-turn-helix transcriptional regulator [Sabulicella glaciei]|uniref:LuxR C-terminal-related transcriptional regulator n=1 Tax=Sabulicella glaciei TaxID=2984948 RepID=A0ABT3NVG9_9PROT|nr:LuxR C-terminal-related transcriptional regulator [Roseococcus sp. MDT2-1-1]